MLDESLGFCYVFTVFAFAPASNDVVHAGACPAFVCVADGVRGI